MRKTDSLVSPFKGTITTNGKVISYAGPGRKKGFATEASARDLGVKGKAYSSDPDVLFHHFVWQHDEWVYKFTETTFMGDIERTKTAWPLTQIKKPGEPARYSGGYGPSKVLLEE